MATPENKWAVSYIIKHALTTRPATALLDADPRKMKTYIHTNT